jgi:hypothetical protein
MGQSTAAKGFTLIDVEQDIADVLKDSPPLRDHEPADYAPPAVRMPDYAVHRNGVNEVGRLSAEAVVREYEAAAKEIEAMGAELMDAAKRCEAMTAGVHTAIAEMRETAARFREEGKRIFLQIEDCALMTAEVRSTCDALKGKIGGPAA